MVSAVCTKTRITIKTADKDFSVSNVKHSVTASGVYDFATAVNTLQVTPLDKIIKYQEFSLLNIG